MENWHVLHCQVQRFDRVFNRVSSLGITCYYPQETRITARKDCASSRVNQRPLLSGYLFVRIDPEVTHPTVLTDIPGAHSFVRFGDEACIVNPKIIEALKAVRIVRLNPRSDCIECLNISPALVAAIQKIYSLPEVLQRQVEFMRLLEQPDFIEELLSDNSRVYTAITPVPLTATQKAASNAVP